MQKKILGISVLATLSLLSVILVHFSTHKMILIPVVTHNHSRDYSISIYKGTDATLHILISNIPVNKSVPTSIILNHVHVPTPNIPVKQKVLTSTIHNLTHVVIKTKTVHHVFTAYYDSREFPNRPCIVLFGYTEHEKRDKIFCTAVYDDNSTVCLGEVIQSLIFHDKISTIYTCRMNSTVKIPTHVQLCKRDKCEDCEHAKRIPVWNREPTVRKSVGVCIQGPLHPSESATNQMLFDMMVEFLAMVKVLGVEIVTIYNTNVKHELLVKILKLYPELLDIVQWNKPVVNLYYHGQSMLLQDCLYRNMYRVKYLVFIDLDEMIFPVSTDNLLSMLEILEKEGRYASYKFPNNFFTTNSSIVKVAKDSCPYQNLPRYFVRLQRLPSPNHSERTKVIVKPDLLSSLYIHGIGPPERVVHGYANTVYVNRSIGMMGHYRIQLTWDMIKGKPVEDRTAMKYKDLVIHELERLCSRL